jgi:hypothetical protein
VWTRVRSLAFLKRWVCNLIVKQTVSRLILWKLGCFFVLNDALLLLISTTVVDPGESRSSTKLISYSQRLSNLTLILLAFQRSFQWLPIVGIKYAMDFWAVTVLESKGFTYADQLHLLVVIGSSWKWKGAVKLEESELGITQLKRPVVKTFQVDLQFWMDSSPPLISGKQFLTTRIEYNCFCAAAAFKGFT